MDSNYNSQERSSTENYSYPFQMGGDGGSSASLSRILSGYQDQINTIRRELRGEGVVTDNDGNQFVRQLVKPRFTLNAPDGSPLKRAVNRGGHKFNEFVPNEVAIEEILSLLKMMGINQVSVITNLSEDTIIDDLFEVEMKLAAVLALKQKEWGLDKELLPLIHTQLKTLIQDARYALKNGAILKALISSVRRIEQQVESTQTQTFSKKLAEKSPYA